LGKVTVRKIEYGVWGNCVEVSNGNVDLVATLDIGPRIIRFGVCDGPNEFFEDKNDELNKNGNSAFDIYGDEGYWHIYGGHRLWTSPEAFPRSYYPDNEPVDCVEIENGVRLTPPPQAWNEIQTELVVVMNEDGVVTVTHNITNIGSWQQEFAIWALTVLKIGGLEVVPQPNKDTGLLGNRILALWPYTNMNDSRVSWGRDYITLRPSKSSKSAFKFGINNEKGFSVYFNHGNMFVKKYNHIDGGIYPDGGVSFETYTNNLMCEMETLGELKKVQPGETISHDETWNLIPNVSEPETNEEIETIIKEYL